MKDTRGFELWVVEDDSLVSSLLVHFDHFPKLGTEVVSFCRSGLEVLTTTLVSYKLPISTGYHH